MPWLITLAVVHLFGLVLPLITYYGTISTSRRFHYSNIDEIWILESGMWNLESGMWNVELQRQTFILPHTNS